MPLITFKKSFTRKRVSFIYLFYWLMLGYIVAALLFWFISLSNQNMEITRLKNMQLTQSDPAFITQTDKIKREEKAKTFQYMGEGLTFLILIIASAIIVFRMLRTQLKISRQHRNFMTAITHELKTPIAVTKLNLETMLKRQLEPSQQQKLITSTLSEADRLNALCNNMLLLNEVGSSGYSLAKEDIFLNDLIDECVKEHKNRFPNRQFIVDAKQEMHIYGDRMLLKLAINNLLDNAVKYSPKESVVKVCAFSDNETTSIKIIDEGTGIQEQDMDKIFLKYYRGASRQAKGTGLGLFVTRQIIRQSKGKLEYTSNNPKGSVFTISFAN